MQVGHLGDREMAAVHWVRMIGGPRGREPEAGRSETSLEPTWWLVRGVLQPWLRTWFTWHIEGLENIPPRGRPALIASNHIAYLDPLAVGYILVRAGRIPRFLAKSELFESRKLGWVLRGTGMIEVRRGTTHAPAALDGALDALAGGEAVVVFPEGTITSDPDLRPSAGKTGIARIALRSGEPVIPVAVWGTANVLPKGYKGSWAPRQPICVRIGEPFRVDGDPGSPDDWRRVAGEVMERIAALVASIRPAVPDRRRPARAA